MFICNHCPYVIATIKDIVDTSKKLEQKGINSVAIMSNDPTDYPEDSFENMIKFAERYNFQFPYILDDDQSVGKKYDAVCTPDFLGYNKNLVPVRSGESDLFVAMKQIAKTGKGPENQTPSAGCGIKWKQ